MSLEARQKTVYQSIRRAPQQYSSLTAMHWKQMKSGVSTILGRRGLLGAMITGAVVAAGITAVGLETTAAEPTTTSKDKRRARYQPTSGEVQTFYRVTRSPPH